MEKIDCGTEPKLQSKEVRKSTKNRCFFTHADRKVVTKKVGLDDKIQQIAAYFCVVNCFGSTPKSRRSKFGLNWSTERTNWSKEGVNWRTERTNWSKDGVNWSKFYANWSKFGSNWSTERVNWRTEMPNWSKFGFGTF